MFASSKELQGKECEPGVNELFTLQRSETSAHLKFTDQGTVQGYKCISLSSWAIYMFKKEMPSKSHPKMCNFNRFCGDLSKGSVVSVNDWKL